MDFAAKLKTLMSICRLNNAILARGIGVDPSLISRWRSGERTPAKNAGLELSIGRFLAAQNMLSLDRAQLEETIGGKYSGRDELADAIASWIIGKPKEKGVFTEEAAQFGEQEAGRISDLVFTGKIPHVTVSGPANLWPLVTKGKPYEHEIFWDRRGKRQAVINFLHSAISSKVSCDIYILNAVSSDWITEDASFSSQWQKALAVLAQTGHSIHMIHPVSDLGEGIFGLIKQYFTLYTSKRLYSYYSPELSFPTSIFAAADVSAAVSYRLHGNNPAEYTVFFNNSTDAVIYEGVFLSYLSSCRELCSVYSEDEKYVFARRLIQLSDLPGKTIMLRQGINPLWLPEGRLYKHLSPLLPQEEIEDLFDILARLRENYESALLSGSDIIEIIPSIYLDAAAQNGSCILPGSEIFCGIDISLTRQDIIECLKRAQKYSEIYPSYRLIFSDSILDDIGIMVKSGHSACLYGGQNGKTAGIFTCEENMLNSIEAWLETESVRHNTGHVSTTPEQIQEALWLLE